MQVASSAVEAATYTATATLVAACIAGTIALLASILSLVSSLVTAGINKRNAGVQMRIAQQVKHADFRQAWINSLRDALIDFQRQAVISPSDSSATSDLMGARSRILLMLNRFDENYNSLESIMFNIVENVEMNDRRSYFGKGSEFISLSQAVLKKEWDATKFELYSVPKDYLVKN